MKFIRIIGICILIISGCQSGQAQGIITAAQLKQKMQNEPLQVIDVRTPDEYNSGHIPKAQNINYYDNNFRNQAAQLDKNKTIYVYCKSGIRSSRACKILKDMGFQKIYNLEGGILKWNQAGLKTEK